MPKAKPVSLYPLSFEEAIKAIVRVESERITPTKRPRQLKNSKKK